MENCYKGLGRRTSSYRKGGHTMGQVALLWNLHPWSYSRTAWERAQQPQLTSMLHLPRRKLCCDWLGPANFPSQPNLFHYLISLSTSRSGFHSLGTEKGSLHRGSAPEAEQGRSSFSRTHKILFPFQCLLYPLPLKKGRHSLKS